MKRKRLFHDHLHEYPNEQQDDFACDQQGRIISDNLVGMASAEVDFSNNLRYNLSKMVDDEEDSVREAVIVRCCLTAKMDYLTQLQTPVIIISANESERKQLEEMIEGLESHAGLRALTLDDFLQDDTADASIQHKIVLMNPLANVEELSAFKSAAEDGCVLLGMAFGCHVDRSAWTFHDEYIAHTRDRLNGSIATAVLASFTNRGLIDSMLSDPLQLTAVELAATLANLKATMDAHPEQDARLVIIEQALMQCRGVSDTVDAWMCLRKFCALWETMIMRPGLEASFSESWILVVQKAIYEMKLGIIWLKALQSRFIGLRQTAFSKAFLIGERLIQWSAMHENPRTLPLETDERDEDTLYLHHWFGRFKGTLRQDPEAIEEFSEVIEMFDAHYGCGEWTRTRYTDPVDWVKQITEWSSEQADTKRRPTVTDVGVARRLADFLYRFRSSSAEELRARHPKAVAMLDQYYGLNVWYESQRPGGDHISCCRRMIAWSRAQPNPMRRPTQQESDKEALSLGRWLMDFKRHYEKANPDVVQELDLYYGTNKWRENQSNLAAANRAKATQLSGACSFIAWCKRLNLQECPVRSHFEDVEAIRNLNWLYNFRAKVGNPAWADAHEETIAVLDDYFGENGWTANKQAPVAKKARKRTHDHLLVRETANAEGIMFWSSQQPDPKTKPVRNDRNNVKKDSMEHFHANKLNNLKKQYMKYPEVLQPVVDRLNGYYGEDFLSRRANARASNC